MEKDTMQTETNINLLSDKTLSARIHQRSDLAQEIISRKPDFIERWSMILFLAILLSLFAASWLVKYPDIIEAKAILTAKNAPKEIIPRQDGRIVKLFVHNNEKIRKTQMIGWIESTANHDEVIELSRQADSCIFLLNQNNINKISAIFNRRYNNLGEIQQGYQQFITAWQLFNDYMINGFYAKKRTLLENDISALAKTKLTIQNQRALTDQDIRLAEETFNMNKKLSDEKVITNEEFRIQKSKFFNKQMAVPQLDASLLANETLSREKLKEIDQLDHDLAQQKVNFRETLQSLKSQIDEWLKRYILVSPVNGKIFFTIPLQENQYVQAGKLLGYINPDNTYFYAEANLSQYNFGKVVTGLPVQLRFDAYPYQETGFVEGKLDYISSVPSDSGFLATVSLNKGLVTNNNKPIPYKNGLKAQAIIITKDMRLLDRLYYNIVKSTSIGNK